MRILRALILSSLLFAIPVFAGSGHDHEHGHDHAHEPISKKEAISKATEMVKNLAAKGTIASSWSKVGNATAEQKTYSHGPEWVIKFKNDKIKDSAKQTLYLFFSLEGHYIATNYTGE